MATTPRHSKLARIYWDYFRVSQIVGQSSQGFQRDEVEVPKLEGEKAFLPGKLGGDASTLNGYVDVADDGFDEISWGATSTLRYIARMYKGNAAEDDFCIETQEYSTGDTHAYDQAGLALLNWSGRPTDGFYSGAVITDGEEEITATGALTGYNRGAITTQLYVVTIRCVSVTGAGSFSVQVEESSDNGAGDAYAQVTGFDIAVSGSAADGGSDDVDFTGKGVARLIFSTAASVEAWRRINVTAFTGFTAASIIVTDGVDEIVA